MSKLDDLIIYKESLDKENNEDKIITILKKLKTEFAEFTIDDFLKSKIGKTLKVINEVKNKEVVTLSNFLMEQMKKVLKKEKEKVIEIEEMKKQSPVKKPALDDNKKNFKDNYKKVLNELVQNESISIRKNVKQLLFDSFIQKEECSIDKLHYISVFSRKIDDTLFMNLYTSEDKGAKYLQRAKNIVFNLGVRYYI